MLPAVWCLATPWMILNGEYRQIFAVQSSSVNNAKIMLLENLAHRYNGYCFVIPASKW